MKIARMNLYKGDSKTVAFFDIETQEGLTVKKFRLVNGPNGIFAATPDSKGKDGKYYEDVIVPKELKTSLEKMALDEYNKLKQ